MPILLNCPCGKTLRVPDTAGGSRVRCPACAAILTASGNAMAADVQLDVIEELGSKPKDDDSARDGYGLKPTENSPIPFAESEEEERDARPRRRSAPRWRSRRGAGRKRAQRQVYLGCGSLAILAGLGLIVGVQITKEEGAVKVMIAGTLIAIFGLVSIVQALTNSVPDDSDI